MSFSMKYHSYALSDSLQIQQTLIIEQTCSEELYNIIDVNDSRANFHHNKRLNSDAEKLVLMQT